MAVVVHDRDGKSWDYARGVQADFDELGLCILDDSGKLVGGFNHAAWTHFTIPAGDISIKGTWHSKT